MRATVAVAFRNSPRSNQSSLISRRHQRIELWSIADQYLGFKMILAVSDDSSIEIEKSPFFSFREI